MTGHMIFPMLYLSNNLKKKKRNINIDLAVLPSHDIGLVSRTCGAGAEWPEVEKN